MPLKLNGPAPIVAVSLAALMALTACQGPSSPSPSPSTTVSSASPTPAASKPTPASSTGPARNIPAPELPEAATKETDEGLTAFANYWIELLSYGYQTGDLKEFDKITKPGCETCSNITSDIKATYSKKGWIVGGESSFVDFNAAKGKFAADVSGLYSRLTKVQQNAATEFDSKGKVVESAPAKPAGDELFIVYASYESGRWILYDFGRRGN